MKAGDIVLNKKNGNKLIVKEHCFAGEKVKNITSYCNDFEVYREIEKPLKGKKVQRRIKLFFKITMDKNHSGTVA
jgi:hypothetical protein